MKIFFDTEFTGLHKNTSLVSIGLVDENGRSFYAELNDYDKGQVNSWIKENVIDNLKYNEYESKLHVSKDKKETFIKGGKPYVSVCLGIWLRDYDSVELVSDVCHYDMVLFIDIFGGAFDIPKNVNPACHDINQDIAKYLGVSENKAFDISREQFIDEYNKIVSEHFSENAVAHIDGDKHNSLYDARVIRVIYNIINENYINMRAHKIQWK